MTDGVDKVVDWWAWPLIGAFLSVTVRFVAALEARPSWTGRWWT